MYRTKLCRVLQVYLGVHKGFILWQDRGLDEEKRALGHILVPWRSAVRIVQAPVVVVPRVWGLGLGEP